jgi:hypothetical protein
VTDHRSEKVAVKFVEDCDEYGVPVTDRYKRLGAGSESTADTGLYVRFEPGFGLNVHIGRRMAFSSQTDFGGRRSEIRDVESMVLGIGGWERLVELVDEWRAREATRCGRSKSERHMEHYRTCGCLGDGSVCCDTSCCRPTPSGRQS